MTRYCPSCQQAVPDPLPLPVRIRRELAQAESPLTAAELRSQTGTSTAVMYQTLRRMKERKEIRKSTHPSFGSGYILTEQEVITPDEKPSTSPALPGLIADLSQYVGAVERVSEDRAMAYLLRLGAEQDVAEVVIAACLETGMLTRDEADLVAP